MGIGGLPMWKRTRLPDFTSFAAASAEIILSL
jgi:hypothetical protein